ncbi:MAG: thioredoxin family protein [Candidatus Kapabacteria bacterium]|nr:thioredoxin family protein [Ignavibacteriota bacterium]MCW5886267.1 thioredoxin family protein [Candidatus Kapabacteria bacterium]
MKENIKEITSFDELNNEISNKLISLVYLSHQNCSVCKVLKPKISELLTEEYPNVKMLYADIEKIPEIKGQFSVFAVPTIIFFIEGRENFRRSRNIGIGELRDLIERPYQFLFSEE